MLCGRRIDESPIIHEIAVRNLNLIQSVFGKFKYSVRK